MDLYNDITVDLFNNNLISTYFNIYRHLQYLLQHLKKGNDGINCY